MLIISTHSYKAVENYSLKTNTLKKQKKKTCNTISPCLEDCLWCLDYKWWKLYKLDKFNRWFSIFEPMGYHLLFEKK